jgi:hypothetical protein
LNYTNPKAVFRYQTPLTALFKATYETKVAEIWVSWSKDWSLPKYSILDFLKYGTTPYPTDLYTGFSYNKDLKLWKDPNTQVKLIKYLNLPDELTNWIGEHKYCDFDFINDEWPF